jgi:hypothetical protein
VRSKQIPSQDTFLVRTPPGKKSVTVKRLAAFGDVQEAGEAGGVLVKLSHPLAGDPKATWEKLQQEAHEAQVDPVLFDESGAPHFPTGEITIRFGKRPSDTFLAKFAKQYGLKVRSRNEYVPAQVAFEVTSHSYLPELIESLTPAESVASAWANTKSQYRRS